MAGVKLLNLLLVTALLWHFTAASAICAAGDRNALLQFKSGNINLSSHTFSMRIHLKEQLVTMLNMQFLIITSHSLCRIIRSLWRPIGLGHKP
jgi:hypothetical protein